MRILLCSHWFYPSFGGVESISRILAEQWAAAGCDVTVVTQTPGEAYPAPYTVVRDPSLSELRALGRKADVIVQNIVSLKTLLPLLTCGKPVVVIHNSWMRKNDGTLGWENRLKHWVVRLTHNVAISRAIAEALPVSSELIGNPFSTTDFSGLSGQPKSKTLVFMGRLVSDKGVDTLLQALFELGRRGVKPDLTIIGDGSERGALTALTEALGLDGQVTFAGALREDRGAVVAQHRVMVVPSRWAEPFGIVALEGIASGCAIVASAQGGLADAVGPCGVLFPNGDSMALADALEAVLKDASLLRSLVEAGPRHLDGFMPERIAGQYLALFQGLLRGKRRGGDGGDDLETAPSGRARR